MSVSTRTLRIWLWPLSILVGVSATLFALTHVADAYSSGSPQRVLGLIFHPDPASAANTLANAGEIVAAVLAIALTVVAIIVELASNRYTHRVTELFISEPVNFAVMGLFVVTALQGMWVTMTFDQRAGDGFVPYFGIGVSMALLTVCLLILLPYFNFVFAYLNPIQIVQRIRLHTLRAIERQRRGPEAAQREAIRGVEQLTDVAVNAMDNRDKGVSMAGINALAALMRDYLKVADQLPEAWFQVGEDVAANPDFVSMDALTVRSLNQRRTWFEMKILRQYQMIYGESLNRIRDMGYVVAINTRKLAEEAAERQSWDLLHMLIMFFNTYLRAAVNAHDVRTAYNVFNQYRRLAEVLLDVRGGAYATEIARYFKHYGLLSYHAQQPFIMETVAYDMCSLCELAAARRLDILDELLAIFLGIDKEGEGAVQEAALRGVRKAQVKLAAFFLERDEEPLARRIWRDMADEDPRRLASIRDELSAVRSPEYWEVTDRGVNFDYIPEAQRPQLRVFFSWFPGLPTDRGSLVSHMPVAPGFKTE